MSGHSKWHSIRRTKGVTDQRRGQLFTKLARDITMAAREGGGDADMNFRLRLAVDKAKSNNMPRSAARLRRNMRPWARSASLRATSTWKA